MHALKGVRARLIAMGLVLATVAAACGGGHKSALAPATTSTTTTTSIEPETTTTKVDGPKAPLTGLIVTDAAVLKRPALAIKVDNIDSTGCETARPQIGIAHADIVYEILVEGITRFMAVFQSDIPETVGPVRSARSCVSSAWMRANSRGACCVSVGTISQLMPCSP